MDKAEEGSLPKGDKKRSADDDEVSPEKKKRVAKEQDEDEDAPSEDEEEEFAVTLLKRFPKDGPRTYILHRVAGGDVLENLNVQNPTGVLEIDPTSGGSAKLWVELPDDIGGIAGRIDCVGQTDNYPHPTYFEAIACKAHVDNGMWQGMIRRGSDTPGAGIFGSIMTMGENIAVAGNEKFTADDPLHIDIVHSVVLKKSEPPIGEDEDVVDGYQPMQVGYLCFTLFIEDGRASYGSGRDAPVPVSLWFRPVSSDGSSVEKIPDNVVADIDKLPPRNEK